MQHADLLRSLRLPPRMHMMGALADHFFKQGVPGAKDEQPLHERVWALLELNLEEMPVLSGVTWQPAWKRAGSDRLGSALTLSMVVRTPARACSSAA